MTGNLLYYEGNVAGLAEDGKKGTSVVVGRAADAEMCANGTAGAAGAGDEFGGLREMRKKKKKKKKKKGRDIKKSPEEDINTTAFSSTPSERILERTLTLEGVQGLREQGPESF
ncbi:hypothetical protein FACUT_7836 [Fusarium acutatum]|uniref:Uncharacterized protein n=1 Tax=Fusarium acutatum TaxID=78861 RepID=A0A8H4NQ20_9HYPO|nr:hypothetical protein FACUT_7836 [Fusarium acutatum]